MKKIILLLLFAAVSWQHAAAQTFSDDGITYDVTSPNTVQVGDQQWATSGIVTIPAQVTYEGVAYDVTTIGDQAFVSCTGLTSVTIPNSVTSIGIGAFNGCSALTSVTIPNSITNIADYTFGGCYGLTSITLPNSVISIGDVAFSNCTGLTSVTIPNSVTSIGARAFDECYNLTSVVIPNSVTSIGAASFRSCSSLTSVIIPNSVTSISFQTFYLCSGLTSVTIPNSVTSIGEHAFSSCSGLTSVTIPNSITSIGNSAFYGCSGLTSVTIPNLITIIGNSAFSNCYGLTSVTIPNSVTSIDDQAFYGCSALTSVTIPNSVTSIGKGAFYLCFGLTSVTIPNSVTSIDTAVFADCSGLTSVNIPNSLTSIGDRAFIGCSALTSVIIPDSVTSIGDSAFYFCSGLTSVTIPNSITSISYAAFYGCSGLTSVICNITTPLPINAFVFENVNQGACSLTVPAGSIAAYQAAAVWQNFNPIKSNIPSTLSLCAGAKVADAVGTSTLKFYSALTGGSVLAATTALVTKTYYATITVNGIASTPRVAVAVTINTLPSAVDTLSASDIVLCKYIGTPNTVTYTATPGASSYLWTVPAGVTIIGGQGTNMLKVDFSTATTSGASTIGNISVKAVNASGCPSALAKSIALSTKLPTAPSKVELTYNGVVKTKVGNYVGDESKTLVLTATDNSNTAAKYTWDLPAGTSIVSGNASSDKTITIHLGGVTAGNTNLVFKVYSIGGCGASIARSLTVTRTAPAAPTALSLTNDAISTNTKITIVSAYTGKFNTTPLTLTAIPSTTAGAEATSYKWVLPSGIGIVDASAAFVSEVLGFTTYTSTTNAIQINLSGVGAATSLLLKVYGVNGNGESLLSKNLTLTSAIPARPGTLTNAFTSLGSIPTYHPSCGGISVQVPNVFGITFTWSIKDGAMATILGDGVGNLQTIDVSQLPTAANSSFRIGVVASNGTGAVERIYTVRFGGSACASSEKITNDANTEIVANEFKVTAYPNPSNNVFNFKVNGANDETVSLLVFDMAGRQIENKVVKANDVENLALGQNYSSGVYNVIVSQGMNTKTVRLVKK